MDVAGILQGLPGPGRDPVDMLAFPATPVIPDMPARLHLLLPQLMKDPTANDNGDGLDNGFTYVPFRAFDFTSKLVSCGGTNFDAQTCGDCKYFNERSGQNYWRDVKATMTLLYWTPNLNLKGALWWESDPRACRGSCTWTGRKCVHKSVANK